VRIAITSRIFDPEPSAATFRLVALASALDKAGHQVEVLTVRPPKGQTVNDEEHPYIVRRFPVLRDRSGYVRGYLPYLSFDVALLFRLLLSRRYDLVVSEPPPTTGFFVRWASLLKRTPYAYYAADIWSDAALQTRSPRWVVECVRRIETVSVRGARTILSVSPAVTDRLREFGVAATVRTVGNGVDVEAFQRGIRKAPSELHMVKEQPVFVYAGTASEWHGAEVFVEAMPTVLQSEPGALLRFIGGGAEIRALRVRANQLGVSHAVSFDVPMQPEKLALILRSATAAVASVRANSSYAFAFPTKLFSAAACGTPLIYSGEGPTREFVATLVGGEPLGVSVSGDAKEVAGAMLNFAAKTYHSHHRERVSEWAAANVSLTAAANRAVKALCGMDERKALS
jgi:glycosyltransferase involved in cell wall biosynthesis